MSGNRFRTWQLPGLLSETAPVAIINRDSRLALSASYPSFQGSHRSS